MAFRGAALLPIVLTLLIMSGARAADQHGDDAQAEAPPLELLEFLGQWETDDGEWIAPEELEDPALVNLLDAVMETGPTPVPEDDKNTDEDVNGASQDDGGSDDSN